MRIEIIPLIVGVLIGVVGLGLLFDAWTPDEILVKRERRRRLRVERHRTGEAMIGLGVLCMAAAFLGRDTWRYSVIAVTAGTALLVLGAIVNRHYFAEVISHRGALRRRSAAELARDTATAPLAPSGKTGASRTVDPAVAPKSVDVRTGAKPPGR